MPGSSTHETSVQRAIPRSVLLTRWFGVSVAMLGLALVASGCVSNEAAERQAQKAFQAGFQQGLHAAEARMTSVFFDGPVRQNQVVWRKGMTLAEAIVAADYTAPTDPRSIVVVRNDRPIPVDPDDVLRGVGFLVQPGDLVRLIP